MIPSSKVAEVAAAAPPEWAQGDRRQSALVQLSRRIIARSEGSQLARDAAALVADSLAASYFGCAEAADGGLQVQLETVHDGAAPPARATIDADPAQSLWGRALADGEPLLVDDLADPSRYCDPLLRRAGLRSAIVCPLIVAGAPSGALLVGHDSAEAFSRRDVEFVEAMGALVASTIARCAVQRQLEQERDFGQELLGNLDALVLTIDGDDRIRRCNRACERLTGFSLGELHERPIWSALLVPEEVHLVRQAFAAVRGGRSPHRLECQILTKYAERRWLSWTFSSCSSGQAGPGALMATAIDITEQSLAAAELQRVRQELSVVQTELGQLRDDQTDQDRAGHRTAEGESRPFAEVIARHGIERRLSKRRIYPYLQLVAPIEGDRLPPRWAFREVRCRDIASGGFSFLTMQPPAYEHLVVAFGAGQSLTYLRAQIVHVTRTNHEGLLMYHVGCSYTGRAVY